MDQRLFNAARRCTRVTLRGLQTFISSLPLRSVKIVIHYSFIAFIHSLTRFFESFSVTQ